MLLSVDDATGKVPYALFQKTEDTEGYFRLMTGIIQRQGIPLALYSDRHAVFLHRRRADETTGAPLAKDSKPTQFGRAMRELGVTPVFARSPEAKGRIERANGTFQDRLVSELRLAGASSIEDANTVLDAFLPRFNERFGVPATLPEMAYRPVVSGVDVAGILCIKERRKVAKDNTVQYYGRTLQLYPDTDRRSYARAYVEVQERLDGRLLAHYRGKILTPGDAPPLAATLRAIVATFPANGLAIHGDTDMSGPPEELAATKKQPAGRGWHGDWYCEESTRCMHRDLVRAGMDRARQEGRRIGRPKVTERPEFAERFAAVVGRIGPGGLSRRQASKELVIGYATLKRLLDAQSPTEQNVGRSSSPVVAVCSGVGS